VPPQSPLLSPALRLSRNLLSESSFRLIELSENSGSAAELVVALSRTIADRDAIVRRSPFVNRRLCRLAASFLERGQSYFGAQARGGGELRKPRLLRRLWSAQRSPAPPAPQPDD
jgi:hypothetical protein